MAGDNGHNRPCPSCGHCPTCGRGGYQLVPWPWYPTYPWYSTPTYPGPVWIGNDLNSPTLGLNGQALGLTAGQGD